MKLFEPSVRMCIKSERLPFPANVSPRADATTEYLAKKLVKVAKMVSDLATWNLIIKDKHLNVLKKRFLP